jgi:homoserine dehydrogenase
MHEIRIFIAGLGHVGRALLALLQEPTSPRVLITGLADSSGAICFTEALSPSGLQSGSQSRHHYGQYGALSLGKPEKSWETAIIEAKKSGLRLVDLGLDGIFGAGQACFRRNVEEAIASGRPQVLVELSSSNTRTGGAATGHAKAAFAVGADVVFASKGALAADWDAIMAAAGAAGRQVRYSATVGGGMPVIDAGTSFAKANPILSIEAVLNGTSVYVLSLMETGLSLDEAVRSAQQAGMSETDPSADLDGLDAAAKLCILARAVMGSSLEVGDVKRGSLRSVTSATLSAAIEAGRRLRAVATLEHDNKGNLQAEVRLAEVPFDSPLARTGSENAVVFHSRFSGTLSMIGKGAGPMETAPAVIRDLAVLSESWCN